MSSSLELRCLYNLAMRAVALIVVLLLSGLGHADSVSEDIKSAREAFQRALKLQQQGHPDEAFPGFEQAARLAPSNLEYSTAREIARQKLVYEHLQKGNRALLADRNVEALAEFRAALAVDPANQFAQQRLQEALKSSSSRPSSSLALVAQSEEIQLAPSAGLRSFHFRGDSRRLFTQIAAAFALTALFDEGFSSRPVAFDLDNAGFAATMASAAALTHAMWTPVAGDQIFIAQESAENHRQLDHVSLRTFYLPDMATPQQLNELVSVLRAIFDIRYVVPNAAQALIGIRAPKATLDAATVFLENLQSARPQVMLDIQAFEISHTLLRNLGLQLPTQFQLINLTAAALAIANQPDIQSQINKIIASGGITPANQAAIQALLAQLQAQQNSTLGQLLNQPFVTFGGGLTRFALVVPPVSFTAKFNDSHVRSLEHVTLRAAQGDTVTFQVGTRYPVLNASFAPLVTSNAIATLLQGAQNTRQTAFPSFNYEDLGITVKARPQIHFTDANYGQPAGLRPASMRLESEVTLDLDLYIRALGGQSLNGIPVISNRQFKGVVRLRDGESSLLVGAISTRQQRSLSGLPGLARLPVLSRGASANNKDFSDDEILVIVTPHVLRRPANAGGTEQWLQ